MNFLRRLSVFHFWITGLLILMVGGIIGGLVVFSQGLSVTNLTDLVPWGLWITIDLSSIALSAGAFTLCAAVYLIGLRKYQPVAKTATFIGIIGYSMAMLCLLVDIGRPDRFWHGFVFWNVHSVMWEVTMCVGLYFTVLTLETIPILADFSWIKQRWPTLSGKMKQIHHIAPYLAIAGLFLSMLHQSSLGALYGVLKSRPLWYSPSLSVLFMYSAIVGGISMTIFVSMVSDRMSSSANIDDRILDKLANFVGWALVGYLYFRFWYTFSMTYAYEPGRTEGLALLTRGPLAINFWLGEIIIGTVIPMVILLKSNWRENSVLRVMAFAMVIGGVIAFRWDINLAGQMIVMPYLTNAPTTLYASYVPSFVEILVGMGVVAYGLLAITLGVKYLGVVDHGREKRTAIEAVVREPSLATGD
jgi:Ni/Fe-hydrogenase subunit HybB-like protein